MKIVIVTKNGLFRRIIPCESARKDKNGQIILPRNHFSAGWIERVWSITWDSLPFLEFPTMIEIQKKGQNLKNGS